MDYLVIDGVRPWDGRYEFSLADRPPTTREWGWIKRHANYLPLTIDEGLRGGDPELFAVFAVIALHRAGKITPNDVADLIDRLQDAPFDSTIRLETDTVDQEAEPDPPGSSDGSSSINGNGSPTSSETSGPTLPDTGTPDWASSVSHHTGSPT